MKASMLAPEQAQALSAAYRGDLLPGTMWPALDALGAMGFVALVRPVGAGMLAVILSSEGSELGRMHREFARWELWRDLYAHLQRRAALERDRARSKVLFRRSKRAYQRAVDALCRVSPEVAGSVVKRAN
ncbi:MAG: hypothetical protein MJE66_15365 [Proteobacteria bacterium]|nr:hypothetical protein [Pseudomonadota bacterium]